MPRALTAFSVKIASPGEMAIKGAIAREGIYDWNACHSWETGRALLPLQVEGSCPGFPVTETDLLLVFVSTAQGVPSDASARATDEEIERQLKAGRPAVVYFSEARVDFAGANAQETRLLEQFKARYPAQAVVDSFKDEKEFRAKFSQQIETILRYHPHFQTDAELPGTLESGTPEPARALAPSYSENAQRLLADACDDPEAYLARMKDARGIKIQVNGRQYVESGSAESAAKWDTAFEELLRGGLIRDVGCHGQLFQISRSGFEYLETLGKHPIGYIPELGSV